MRRFLSSYVLGPLLAVARFYQAHTELKIVRNVDDKLEERHLQTLAAFTDRINMIKSFLKEAIVAEIGVTAGDFTSIILREKMPEKLSLIET